MKRLIALMARLYPRSWREEFGDEFDALLDDVKPRWRVFANVLGGAIEMQITTGTNWLRMVGAAAVIGAILAGGLSFAVAPHYVSSATVSVTPQADPVRPTSPQVVRQRAAERIAEMEIEILSRYQLYGIIHDPKLDLYKEELQRRPFDDVVEEMRRNIRIQTHSSANDVSAPIVLSIAFSYPDQVKAQAVVRALAARFTEENVKTNRDHVDAYRGFWLDMAKIEHGKPTPPPPVGEIVKIVDSAGIPVKSEGPHGVFLAWGLGAGLLLGLLGTLAMRWPRGVWQLAGFAAAGCFLAGCASFLIPNRYTSTAVMMLVPAQITEDPMASIPPVTPAAEFLRQMNPQVLSFQSLSGIIQDRRLNLYPSERTRMPIEEVVRNMAERDFRIVPLNPASGVRGTVSAFSISFSYSDRFKTQRTVQAVMNAFEELRLNQARAKIASEDLMLRVIAERKAGEVLKVLDTPPLPQHPDAPDHLMIAAAGLGGGFLLGAIILGLRRPRSPVLQPAGCTTAS